MAVDMGVSVGKGKENEARLPDSACLRKAFRAGAALGAGTRRA
jgi:hypothetical protein